jgi:hypothetical protein
MLFQLPPAIPAVEAIAEVVAVSDKLFADCEKGSRDCFPEDRVGLGAENVTYHMLDLSWENVLAWAWVH